MKVIIKKKNDADSDAEKIDKDALTDYFINNEKQSLWGKILDISRKNSIILNLTKENIALWKENPSKYDIIIDKKLSKKSAIYKELITKWRNSPEYLKRYKKNKKELIEEMIPPYEWEITENPPNQLNDFFQSEEWIIEAQEISKAKYDEFLKEVNKLAEKNPHYKLALESYYSFDPLLNVEENLAELKEAVKRISAEEKYFKQDLPLLYEKIKEELLRRYDAEFVKEALHFSDGIIPSFNIEENLEYFSKLIDRIRIAHELRKKDEKYFQEKKEKKLAKIRKIKESIKKREEIEATYPTYMGRIILPNTPKNRKRAKSRNFEDNYILGGKIFKDFNIPDKFKNIYVRKTKQNLHKYNNKKDGENYVFIENKPVSRKPPEVKSIHSNLRNIELIKQNLYEYGLKYIWDQCYSEKGIYYNSYNRIGIYNNLLDILRNKIETLDIPKDKNNPKLRDIHTDNDELWHEVENALDPSQTMMLDENGNIIVENPIF